MYPSLYPWICNRELMCLMQQHWGGWCQKLILSSSQKNLVNFTGFSVFCCCLFCFVCDTSVNIPSSSWASWWDCCLLFFYHKVSKLHFPNLIDNFAEPLFIPETLITLEMLIEELHTNQWGPWKFRNKIPVINYCLNDSHIKPSCS